MINSAIHNRKTLFAFIILLFAIFILLHAMPAAMAADAPRMLIGATGS